MREGEKNRWYPVPWCVSKARSRCSVPDLPDSPCYRCLYAESNEPEEPCAEFGVLAPAAGIIGSIQAAETLKLLLGVGQTLTGRVLLLDVLTMEWRELKLRKDPACPVCSGA